MGAMTCVVCGREMTSYNPLRRCQECQWQSYKDGIFRSLQREWGERREPEYSASSEPETTDWIRPMGERFRYDLELGIGDMETPESLMGRHRTEGWENRVKEQQSDTHEMGSNKNSHLAATAWHGMPRSEDDLLAPFSEQQQATLRFYKHMVELGVVEHQTEPANEE